MVITRKIRVITMCVFIEMQGEMCMNEEKIFKLESPYQPTGDQPQAIEQADIDHCTQ